MQSAHIQASNGRSLTLLHRGSTADLNVVQQIFAGQDYALERLRRGPELVDQYAGLGKPFILDAGANIGASVSWFALNFPNSHILAFEPDPGNFELLEMNSAALNVDRRRAALGSTDGKVHLVDPGIGEWGYQAVADAAGEIDLISVSRVVEEKVRLGYQPFIAKIDIEGGEEDLFKAPADWADAFPLVIVELHDWMLTRQRTSRTFLEWAASRDRDFVHISENVFSIRN